jgi:hypothetical protein
MKVGTSQKERKIKEKAFALESTFTAPSGPSAVVAPRAAGLATERAETASCSRCLVLLLPSLSSEPFGLSLSCALSTFCSSKKKKRREQAGHSTVRTPKRSTPSVTKRYHRPNSSHTNALTSY